MYRYRSTGTAACTVPVHRYMRTQTPTKRVYLLDPNGVKNLALDGMHIFSKIGQKNVLDRVDVKFTTL